VGMFRYETYRRDMKRGYDVFVRIYVELDGRFRLKRPPDGLWEKSGGRGCLSTGMSKQYEVNT
jgi:hypothetical protein